MLNQPGKRRQEIRYHLDQAIPATVLLRGVRSIAARGIAGTLIDASNAGMGVLVQEHVALESRCTIELEHGQNSRRFGGEVCYVKRTPQGLKLGIMLAPENETGVLDYLAEIGIELKLPE